MLRMRSIMWSNMRYKLMLQSIQGLFISVCIKSFWRGVTLRFYTSTAVQVWWNGSSFWWLMILNDYFCHLKWHIKISPLLSRRYCHQNASVWRKLYIIYFSEARLLEIVKLITIIYHAHTFNVDLSLRCLFIEQKVNVSRILFNRENKHA